MTGGHRAIGIALRPYGRCITSCIDWGRIDAIGAITGPPEEAVEELYAAYHHHYCQPSRRGTVLATLKYQDFNAQGGSAFHHA